jgi:hypothetical protein
MTILGPHSTHVANQEGPVQRLATRRPLEARESRAKVRDYVFTEYPKR